MACANPLTRGLCLLVVVSSLFGSIFGFECRICSYSSNSDSDDSCVSDPTYLDGPQNRYHCNRTCVIQENYSIEEERVISFIRTCSSVEKTGYCTQDPWAIVCFYSCLGYMCNDFVGDLHRIYPVKRVDGRLDYTYVSDTQADNSQARMMASLSGVVWAAVAGLCFLLA